MNNYDNFFYVWQESYHKYLLGIYYIFRKNFQELEIVDEKMWENKDFFDNFCYLLYKKSSKNISPYL